MRFDPLALRSLKSCDNPECQRRVPVGTLYCCSPCSFAADTQSEITAHSEGCNERHAQRSGEEAGER